MRPSAGGGRRNPLADGRVIGDSRGSLFFVARLVLLFVLLLMVVGEPVGASSPQESPEEQPPVKRAAPTYTDEDLAR
jgi:hypothetical protein